jgi:hypothetical protein
VKFSQKTYDRLKWLVTIVMPAFVAFLLGVDPLWDLPILQPIAGTVALLSVFLGASLQISSSNFQRDLGVLADQYRQDLIELDRSSVLDGTIVVDNSTEGDPDIYASFDTREQLEALKRMPDNAKVTLRVLKSGG